LSFVAMVYMLDRDNRADRKATDKHSP
jgi:hypothetical protein